MGIYKRGRVYWIDFYDPNRNRVQESSQSTTRRDAENLLALRRSEILRGVYKQPVKMTFGEFGERYMEHAKTNKRSWLRDQQMLENLYDYFGKENPVRKVKFFREFNTGLRVVSPEEEKSLLQNASPYLQDLIRFALNMGLRIGEIFSLRWSNVDLQKGILNVFAPKTQRIREVPVNSETRKVLEAWRLHKKSEFVFYNPETGKPFVDLKNGFALGCKKAGISGVTWHTLRHTFASRLVGSGVDIVTVKELLGHSSISVTMRYAHTNFDSKRAAVEKLDGFGDNLVTVPKRMHHNRAKLSLIGAASYNTSRS